MNRTRNCLRCGKDITDHHYRTKRCPECSKAHFVEYRKNYNKVQRDRKCLGCGIDLTDFHGKTLRCEECHKEYYREYQKDYRETKRKGKERKDETMGTAYKKRKLIMELRLEGVTIKDISETVKVSVNAVCKILNQSNL